MVDLSQLKECCLMCDDADIDIKVTEKNFVTQDGKADIKIVCTHKKVCWKYLNKQEEIK